MLASSRSLLRNAATRRGLTPVLSCQFSSPPPAEEEEESAVAVMREELRKNNPFQVVGATGKNYIPAPVLPESPKEIAALDPADVRAHTKIDGSARTVIIRQDKRSARQSPLSNEKVWRIAFYEDGIISQTWENPLMGWTSNSDPYSSAPPLTFPNAADAVYFAKKRGWNYIVKKPILRSIRSDGTRYQDNFLPKATAAQVQKEGTSCAVWERSSAGTSHYFRPLKYHGDGTVVQHGPNGSAEIAKAPEGYYKMR